MRINYFATFRFRALVKYVYTFLPYTLTQTLYKKSVLVKLKGLYKTTLWKSCEIQ